MGWLELINTAACLILLMFLLGPAHLANKWRHRIVILPLPVIVALQAMDPFVAWIPDMSWPAVAMNVALAIAVGFYRKELYAMAKASFSDEVHTCERRALPS